MKTLFFSLIFCCAFLSVNGQQLDTLSISDKFDKVYRTSSRYQEYKVIKISQYLELKDQVLDSIQDKNTLLKRQEDMLSKQQDTVSTLKFINTELEKDMKYLLTEKNSISFLGISLTKFNYNLFVWTLIIILVCLLVFMGIKMKANEITTKKAVKELTFAEEELRLQKKKSLEREQKLRRQLQDEINKKRGV